MKKILALSDIHMPSRLNNLPYDLLTKYMSDIDMIFGLGDYVSQEALSSIYGFNKEVCAVSGNMDDYIIKSELPAKRYIKVEDINIGLSHGWGSPFGIREKLYKEFENVDLICYGHTHSSYFKEENGIVFFNPGSFSGPNPSFGVLTISGKNVEAEIIKL